MIIEVDQSGKVEDTHVDTVVGLANDTFRYSVRLSARDKRKLQKVFREAGKPDTFVYRVFAALISFAVADYLSSDTTIVIDEEYTGKETLIKLFLLRYIRSAHLRSRLPEISFRRIGKKSPAHDAAYYVFVGERRANRVISSQDVLRLVL